MNDRELGAAGQIPSRGTNVSVGSPSSNGHTLDDKWIEIVGANENDVEAAVQIASDRTDARMAASSNGSKIQRFSGGRRCPVCGGEDGDPRGIGQRCHGFISDDGEWIHCAREEHSSGCRYSRTSDTYVHKARGQCHCGKEHGPASVNGHVGTKTKLKGAKSKTVAVYSYVDEAGEIVHETVRKNPKRFLQRRPAKPGEKGDDEGYVWKLNGITPVLYNLPRVIKAGCVVVVEGEKDVDNLDPLLGSDHRVATTNPMGAGKWRLSYSETLRGKDVVVIPDEDKPDPKTGKRAGIEHAQQVASSLAGIARSVKLVRLPIQEGQDVSDWIKAGGTLAELDQIIDVAPEWPASPTATAPVSGAAPATPPATGNNPIVNSRGNWTSCIHNTLLWLSRPGKPKIRYDTFACKILVDGHELTDQVVIRLTAEIEADIRSQWSQDHVRAAIIDIAHRDEFSSLTEWLDSLVWDQKLRIHSFFERAYGFRSDAADPTDQKDDMAYAAECGRVMFLQAVARAYQPGCQADTTIVLTGPQGVYKSTGIKALSPEPGWFTDNLGGDLHDRKPGEGLRGKWLVEFAELSRINRATIETVKGFLSCSSDNYRPPYAKHSADFPRQCVFFGTSNRDQPLLDTENRRFLPVPCPQGDIDWIKANRDQLWAEAVARFKAGEKWWVEANGPSITKIVRAKQEDARQEDSWVDALRDGLGPQTEVTIIDAARALRIGTEHLDRSKQMRIAAALKALGYERKYATRGGSRQWVYRK